MTASILATDRITMEFGGLRAVSALNLEVAPGEIIGIIGPNGAGKTTVFNMITGVYKPTKARSHRGARQHRFHRAPAGL